MNQAQPVVEMRAYLARKALKTVSPAGIRGKLSIFIFHRVLDSRDPLFPSEIETRAEFDEILGWLGEWFNVIPLADAVRRLAEGRLPERAACITFDDGYADNYLNAVPVLQHHGLHATFFIATGFLDGGVMWNDRVIEAVRATQHTAIDARLVGLGVLSTGSVVEKRAAIRSVIPSLKHRPPGERADAVQRFVELCEVRPPGDLMLSSEQLKALHRTGMGVGAHTVTHPILATCGDDQARDEIAGGREFLENLLGIQVGLFAYPNGKLGADYTSRDAVLVRELGFEAAVSTNSGASTSGDDLYQLRRFTPWDRRRWRFLLRTMRNLLHQNR